MRPGHNGTAANGHRHGHGSHDLAPTTDADLRSGFPDAADPIGAYLRVSTDDQADRDTIAVQEAFLRRFAETLGRPIFDLYADDGVSGKIPFDRRPQGRRLLADAEAGRFRTACVMKVSRLARDQQVGLKAYDQLAARGVLLRSGTEPMEPETFNGMFVFQLLLSVAQLDHGTIGDQTSRGRRRVAANGHHTGGPIPMGMDVAENGLYVPSSVPVPELGCTEADLMADMLERLAAGTTTVMAEWTRLQTLAVARRQRFALSAARRRNGEAAATIENPHGWGYSSLLHALKNPILMGEGRYRAAAEYGGEVVRPAAGIVSREVWEAAQRTIAGNRAGSSKNATRFYPLRGLIVCANCGGHYTGATIRQGTHAVYRCNGGNRAQAKRGMDERCWGKQLSAEWLEGTVWEFCEAYVRDPNVTIEDARRRMRARLAAAPELAQRRQAVAAELAGKDAERERMHARYRKGRLSEAEYDRQLDAIDDEAGRLHAEFERLRTQAAAAEAQEAHLAETAAFLARIRADIDEIVATDDRRRKAAVMAKLVREITVESRREDEASKRSPIEAEVQIALRLEAEASHIVSSTSKRADNYMTLLPAGPLLVVAAPGRVPRADMVRSRS